MAFVIRNFSVLNYANGHTMWYYKGLNDTLEAICTNGFFNDVDEVLELGDMIVISAANGARIVVVTEVGDTVRVAPLS